MKVNFTWTFFIYTIVVASPSVYARERKCDTIETGFQCNRQITHSWGPYTPYFSVYSDVPKYDASCKTTFVQLLSRHGARSPTAGATKKIKSTINKIQASGVTYDTSTKFVKDYVFDLVPDQLSTFGQQEMVNSGIKFSQKYSSLARRNEIFVRSSGQERVVVSALNFTQGFCGKNNSSPSCMNDLYTPLPILVIPEDDGQNNTLSHGLCWEFEEGKYANLDKIAAVNFTAIFAPPITTRLNMKIQGANLTDDDTVNLISLCAFDTVAKDDATPLSQFCSLFTPAEFTSYNYLQSLTKYYNIGPGNPLGATQGVGYVNELIARLTNTPVVDHTSTNQTLDQSNATFPLGLKLYADFSHDNDMVGVMTALGLFNGTELLSTAEQDDEVDFQANKLVPFASRIYVEKLMCKDDEEELVRILVNDKVMPMSNCGSDKWGRCTLSNFVAGLSFAKSGGLWDQCGSAPS